MRRTVPPPEQLYFTTGEAARIVGVKDHVLRHWEKAFHPLLRPQRTGGRHRRYRRRDIEVAVQIRRLLYDEKMTIEGARQRLLSPAETGQRRHHAPGARREARLRTELAVLRQELAWLLEQVEQAHRLPVAPRVVADEDGVHVALQVTEPARPALTTQYAEGEGRPELE